MFFQNEVGIPLEDRIAFASIFLSDVKLTEYINTITDKLLDQGNLTAIFLTGNFFLSGKLLNSRSKVDKNNLF